MDLFHLTERSKLWNKVGMKIADLRNELGLSLEAFAERVGLQSKGRMSMIERENRCSLAVALRIEELSEGRIDAAGLSDDVHAARLRCIDVKDTASPRAASSGNDESASSLAPAARP